MTMEALPIELLTHILQYLSPIDRIRSEQVSRKWKDASRQTWRDIKKLYIIHPFNYDYYGMFEDWKDLSELVGKEGNRLFIGLGCPEMIRCLVSRVGWFIEKVHLDTFRTRDNKGIDYPTIILFLSSYCRNLKVLVVGYEFSDYVKQEWWSVLFDCNQKLHSVLSDCHENLIKALPYRNWRSLRLTRGGEDDEEKIVSLIENSKDLEEFGTRVFTTRIVEALLKLRNLKSLYYRTPEEGPSPEMMFDAPLLNRLRNLKFTDMDHNSQLLCDMLPHCCQLRSLSIACFFEEGFPMNVLEAILAVPTLEILQIHSSDVEDDILIHLTKFRSLSLTSGQFDELFTNNGIIDMIKRSEILENLDITLTNVTPELFETLVRETSNRQKDLNVAVSCEIFDEVSKICTGSKIHLVKYIQCFRDDY